MKKLLIIGGAGFIGRHLVLGAVNKGYQITVLSLHHVESANRIDGVDYLISDVVNYDLLKKTLSGKVFTHVVNLGGYINHSTFKSGGRDILDSHFTSVLNLVQLLNWDNLISFVQIGSSDEYGNSPAPQSEDIRESPISSYSLGKLASSQFLQMLHRTEGFPATVLRFFLVYGPEQNKERFLPQIIAASIQGESFPTSEGMQLRDFCYVSDAVEAILLALENTEVNGEIINIATGEPVSIRLVLEKVITMIGGGTPRFGETAYRKGENMSLYADVSLAKSLLGWESKTSLETGLKNTIDWVRAQE